MIMLQDKTIFHIAGRMLQFAIVMWPTCGLAELRGLPPAPNIVFSPADISIQQPLASSPGIVEPFLGTNIDVAKFVHDAPSEVRNDPDHKKYFDDYQIQAGVNIDIGKSVALNFDPNSRHVNTELSFSSNESNNSKTRFRLRVRTHELRVMMLHKF
jgi:hypothetical protein